MIGIRLLIVATATYVSASNAFAQVPDYSAATAERMLTISQFPGACAVPIPEREFSGNTIEFAQTQRELLATITALKDIGLITITDLPGMLGSVHFKVTLRTDIDRGDLIRPGNSECIKRWKSNPGFKVVGVDKIKGGVTNWDDVIISAIESFDPTPLYSRYLVARKAPPAGSDRLRVLYKFDPFKKCWVLQTWDIAPLSQTTFSTNNVPNALRLD